MEDVDARQKDTLPFAAGRYAGRSRNEGDHCNIGSMFNEKGTGNVEMPPKPGIHTRTDAFIHAMPAYIPHMKVEKGIGVELALFG